MSLGLRRQFDDAAITYKNYIIIIGGTTNGTVTNDIFAFNVLNSQCQQIKLLNSNITKRYGETVCLFDENKILAYGGALRKEVTDCVEILTIIDSTRKI